MKYFKEKQKVYSVQYGEGVVISIEAEGLFDDWPIRVAFREQDIEVTYTEDGREVKSENISLFQKPVTVPINEPLKEKFAILDWIVITNNEHPNNWVSSMDIFKNRVVRITNVKITGGGKTVVQFKGSDRYAFILEDGHFRKATSKEVPCPC
jgi:hypothetical protein